MVLNRWWHGRRRLSRRCHGRPHRRPALQQAVRNGIVIQPRNMPQRERQVGRGLGIGSVEDAVLGGVLVGQELHMERALDGRHGTLDLNVHRVARAARDGESIAYGELHHGVILRLARTKLRGELGGRHKLVEQRAAGVIDLAQKRLEASRIAQRQHNIQAHDLAGRESANRLRLTAADCIAHMPRQRGLRLRTQ